MHEVTNDANIKSVCEIYQRSYAALRKHANEEAYQVVQKFKV